MDKALAIISKLMDEFANDMHATNVLSIAYHTIQLEILADQDAKDYLCLTHGKDR
jgi:hypothetical protein